MNRPSHSSPAVHRLSGSLLSLLMLVAPVRVLAHGGHGNEFQSGGQATQAVGAVKVDAQTQQRIGIQIESATRKRLSFGVKATGQIEALPSRQVEVTNPTGGQVIKLFVQPGDTVRAGQPVALLTSPDLANLRAESLTKRAEAEGDTQQAAADLKLAQDNYARQQQIAQAEVQQAKVALSFAQERYDRDQELSASGALPRRTVLESESKLSEAKADFAKAQSRLPVVEATAQLKRAQSEVQVARSRVSLSDAGYSARLRQLGATANSDGTVTITAPISGKVADREVTLGQAAEDAGSKLMTILDGQSVLATGNVYEKDLNQISQGQQVRVTVSGLQNRPFTGRITVVGSVVEGETRVVPVKAELDNSSGVLKPGMFAEMEVLVDRTPTSVLAVPASAIVDTNDKKKVVFVQNGDSFQPSEVTIGRTAGDLVEITDGLFDGDKVVTQGAPQLYTQSLRGSSTAEAEHAELPAAKPQAVLPWWAIVPIAGGAIGGAFYAGMLWTRKRDRIASPQVIESKSIYFPEQLSNSHRALPTFPEQSKSKSDS